MFLYWLLIIIVSILLAKVEINIEGKYGYAKNLPVEWRTENKWLKMFFAGTSYHMYMGLFLVVLFHLPFVVGLEWSWRSELLILATLSFITVFEDFLWFVLNPHYGIKKFKRDSIPWFKDRWFLFCPAWYWWYLPVGVVMYVLAIVGDMPCGLAE